ncbi:MAG: hypothetical protein WCX17_01105 [Parcubacteria group bacterium]|jgi:hypothetical protein
MKKTALTQEEYEFLLLMSAKPRTEEGKGLMSAALKEYFEKINWDSLARTPMVEDDDQRRQAEEFVGPCDFSDGAEKVTLMIDDSANCTEAVELLKECGVPFEISPSSSENLPCARYKDELYCGLPDIRLLLEGLGFGDKARARWDRMNAEALAT